MTDGLQENETQDAANQGRERSEIDNYTGVSIKVTRSV